MAETPESYEYQIRLQKYKINLLCGMLTGIIIMMFFYLYLLSVQRDEIRETIHMREEQVQNSVDHYLKLKEIFGKLTKAEGRNLTEVRSPVMKNNATSLKAEEHDVMDADQLQSVVIKNATYLKPEERNQLIKIILQSIITDDTNSK